MTSFEGFSFWPPFPDAGVVAGFSRRPSDEPKKGEAGDIGQNG